MAEALLMGVLTQLAPIIQVEVGVVNDVKDLTSSLSMVLAVLKDAEMKQVRSEAVKHWLQELKHILYDADDVFDEWKTQIEISKLQNSVVTDDGVPDQVRSYISSLSSFIQPVVIRYKIAHRIRDVKGKLEKHRLSVDQLKLVANYTKEDGYQPRKFTSSILNDSEMKGREYDTRVIVDKLLAESSTSTQTSVVVVSIVGVGGLGKTALAQLVYNDEKVISEFDLKVWVCVSEPFDPERLFRDIIKQASGGISTDDVLSLEALQHALSKVVKRKRFLVVLDDVFTESYEDWYPLKLSLDHGAPGSRVLVTTRSTAVANIMGSSYTHKLGILADDDCWLLFQHVALPQPSEEQLEEFEEFKDEIVDKCKGVPLEAKALGGLMRLMQTKQEWRNVLSSHIWKQSQDGRGGSLLAISLSYQYLPSHIKQCFAYTAVFPKDTVLEKEKLVKLWMAQGLLGLVGNKKPEMIGVMVFDELAMRSFFQDFKKCIHGNILTCKMHDLVHDFAQSLTKTECSIVVNSDIGSSASNVRHVYAKSLENPGIYEAKKVRTLMISPKISASNLSGVFDRFKCLRALDVSYGSIEALPGEVERLLHLRYLDLSHNYWLYYLPETMGNLYHLQTLKLNACIMLENLPRGIVRLSNLRHLELEESYRLKCMPKCIGKLSQLRTLSRFALSEECTFEELGRLNHLGGYLDICRWGGVENEEEAKRARLHEKENLWSLKFSGVKKEDAKGLQPHKNLEKLEIDDYNDSSFPLWMLMCDSLLPTIVELKLASCENCIQLPRVLGKLRYLEILELSDLPLMKDLSAQLLGVSNAGGSGASSPSIMVVLYPKLRELLLDHLEEWDEEIEEASCTSIMPCLESLQIIGCRKLKMVPHYMFSPSLKTLYLAHCSKLTEGMQPCLPVHLEMLTLVGDVGVFSRSLLSVSSSYNNHHLKSVYIYKLPYSSLPRGLSSFTSLRKC